MGLWILGILLLLLVLLMLLRLGAEVSFGPQLCVQVRVGPGRLQILPRQEKEKKPAPEKQPQKSAPEQKPAKPPKPGFVLADVRPEIPVLL